MKRITVVEDDELMRQELKELLRGAGYEVDCVEDFDDPAPALLRGAADLILLDLNLPGTSGFELCRQIKARSAAPVLVLTSRDQLRDELLRWNWGRMNI